MRIRGRATSCLLRLDSSWRPVAIDRWDTQGMSAYRQHLTLWLAKSACWCRAADMLYELYARDRIEPELSAEIARFSSEADPL